MVDVTRCLWNSAHTHAYDRGCKATCAWPPLGSKLGGQGRYRFKPASAAWYRPPRLIHEGPQPYEPYGPSPGKPRRYFSGTDTSGWYALAPPMHGQARASQEGPPWHHPARARQGGTPWHHPGTTLARTSQEGAAWPWHHPGKDHPGWSCAPRSWDNPGTGRRPRVPGRARVRARARVMPGTKRLVSSL